jgi:glycosyltransferase involved in cell wall biosynthesis
MISLLGRRDHPTDALEEYSASLGRALAHRGYRLELVRVPWAEHGWIPALRELSRQSVAWKDEWVLVQYTALSWSRRGVPLGLLAVLWRLKRAKARIAIVFHDPVGHLGKRLVDRLRRGLQHFVMRAAYRFADRAVLPIPTERARWLPRNPAKAVFIPVGSNIPVPEEGARLPAVPDTVRTAGPTVAVFGITPGHRQEKEVAVIAESLRAAAREILGLRLVAFGRGTSEAEGALRRALEGAGVDVSVRGLLPGEEVARVLGSADVLLDVRDTVSSRRSAVIAAIACGVPVIGYQGYFTDALIANAGVRLVPEGDTASLSAALRELLTDAALRQSLRERARAAHREIFAWDRIADRVLATLESPVGRWKESSQG